MEKMNPFGNVGSDSLIVDKHLFNNIFAYPETSSESQEMLKQACPACLTGRQARPSESDPIPGGWGRGRIGLGATCQDSA